MQSAKYFDAHSLSPKGTNVDSLNIVSTLKSHTKRRIVFKLWKTKHSIIYFPSQDSFLVCPQGDKTPCVGKVGEGEQLKIHVSNCNFVGSISRRIRPYVLYKNGCYCRFLGIFCVISKCHSFWLFQFI